MENIRNWAFSLCVSAICGSLLNMLLPEGSGQKTFKFVLCIFLLCVILSPLKDIDFPDYNNIFIKSEYVAAKDDNNEFINRSEDFIEEQIKKDTSEILTEYGIDFKDIIVEVNILENQSIDITEFSLFLPKTKDTENIKSKIQEKIGISPEVIIMEEEEVGTD